MEGQKSDPTDSSAFDAIMSSLGLSLSPAKAKQPAKSVSAIVSKPVAAVAPMPVPNLNQLLSYTTSLNKGSKKNITDQDITSSLVRKLCDLVERNGTIRGMIMSQYDEQMRFEGRMEAQRKDLLAKHREARNQLFAQELLGKDITEDVYNLEMTHHKDLDKYDRKMMRHWNEFVQSQLAKLAEIGLIPFMYVTDNAKERILQQKILAIILLYPKPESIMSDRGPCHSDRSSSDHHQAGQIHEPYQTHPNQLLPPSFVRPDALLQPTSISSTNPPPNLCLLSAFPSTNPNPFSSLSQLSMLTMLQNQSAPSLQPSALPVFSPSPTTTIEQLKAPLIFQTKEFQKGSWPREAERVSHANGRSPGNKMKMSPGKEAQHYQTRKSGARRRINSDFVDEKRLQALERNRQAAMRCRQRKRERLEGLKAKAEYLTHDNETMMTEIMQLKEEVLSLKTKLLEHRDCCTAVENGLEVRHIEKCLSQETIMN